MVTKKLISLGLLLTIFQSMTQCAASGSGTITIKKNSISTPTTLPAIGQTPPAVPVNSSAAPAAAAAATTSVVTATPTNPATMIGQPYSRVTIDAAIQIEPFVIGRTAIDGHHKGMTETSLAYVKRLTNHKRLTAALTNPARTTQKSLERLSEAIKEADAALNSLKDVQSLELQNFLTQQHAVASTFSNTQKAITTALLTRQRASFTQAISDVDTVLQIVATMPEAKGSLSDACIREELTKLQDIQRQKEADLKILQTANKTLLQNLTDTCTFIAKQEEDELNAQINVTRQQRELLHSVHPAPTTLAPLSPRQSSAPAAEGKTKR